VHGVGNFNVTVTMTPITITNYKICEKVPSVFTAASPLGMVAGAAAPVSQP